MRYQFVIDDNSFVDLEVKVLVVYTAMPRTRTVDCAARGLG